MKNSSKRCGHYCPECDENLYSIKFKGKYNIRILYSYDKENDECLLLSFFEKAGKRKTEYSHYIPIAQRRFNELSDQTRRNHYE